MTIVILEDAAADMESGRRFYESCEAGIGDYFTESLLSDLDSLVLYAGIHPIHFGFHRMLSKRFPFGIYYEVEHEVAYRLRHPGHAARSSLAPQRVAKKNIANEITLHT
ncbi:MAG: hypothetical protein QOK48_2582 [Blastocatellia bacterium]|jgi:hypothetical protein|nr:hypothetical protein [Blastocatellia bacterium]